MERIRLKAGLAFESSSYENHLPPRNLACSSAAQQELKNGNFSRWIRAVLGTK